MRSAQSASTASTTSANDRQGEPPAAHLRRLWERMVAMYGHPWVSLNGVSPQHEDGRLTVAGDSWSKGLVGLTPAELAHGLEVCLAEGGEFAPNPGVFRRKCLGIPDFGAVSHEILCAVNAERSPFARLVWGFVDAYAHRHAAAPQAERMRREAYEQAVEHVMRGGALPDANAGAIEHHEAPKPQGIPDTKGAREAKLAALLGADYIPPEKRINPDVRRRSAAEEGA